MNHEDMVFDRAHPELGRVTPSIGNDLAIGYEYQDEEFGLIFGVMPIDAWFALPFWAEVSP